MVSFLFIIPLMGLASGHSIKRTEIDKEIVQHCLEAGDEISEEDLSGIAQVNQRCKNFACIFKEKIRRNDTDLSGLTDGFGWDDSLKDKTLSAACKEASDLFFALKNRRRIEGTAETLDETSQEFRETSTHFETTAEEFDENKVFIPLTVVIVAVLLALMVMVLLFVYCKSATTTTDEEGDESEPDVLLPQETQPLEM